jgi:rubredoxin
MTEKDKPKYGKIKKRCPKCRCARIYRRIRRDGISRYRKPDKTNLEKITKQYICRNCGHEFDNPLVQ